jgi:hypothetical protein
MYDLEWFEMRYKNHMRLTLCPEVFAYVLKLLNLGRVVEHHFKRHYSLLDVNLEEFGDLEEDDVANPKQFKKESSAAVKRALEQAKRHTIEPRRRKKFI